MNLQFLLDLAQTAVLAMLLFRRVRMDRRIGQEEIDRLNGRLSAYATQSSDHFMEWKTLFNKTRDVARENGELKARIEALTPSVSAPSTEAEVQ